MTLPRAPIRSRRFVRLPAVLLGCLFSLAPGCGDGSAPGPTGRGDAAAAAVDPEEALAARGRQIYMSTCIACHNPDPSRAGTLGPEIAGSPRELVESKVLRNEYPEGYQPKRETRAMVPLPHLEPDIDALVAFLASSPES